MSRAMVSRYVGDDPQKALDEAVHHVLRYYGQPGWINRMGDGHREVAVRG
jgi:hypothetical protein